MPLAENNLGSMYKNGFGVTQSYQVPESGIRRLLTGLCTSRTAFKNDVLNKLSNEAIALLRADGCGRFIDGRGGSYAGGGTRGRSRRDQATVKLRRDRNHRGKAQRFGQLPHTFTAQQI
jgi:hypothetical protein